ncbi:hypothetical protein POM88_054265 [Heracleum sosnowskyi]|uniref:Uncharacterized protein n=1 Tax=Heracleum sosnowskyi TaxID=360622 RepID=A0AAD8GN62_9APIA|nr:hypothetical protein POM88_054265 [Heracleum sosnowskyi]
MYRDVQKLRNFKPVFRREAWSSGNLCKKVSNLQTEFGVQDAIDFGVMTQKSVGVPFTVPITCTSYKTTFNTPKFSPTQLLTLAKGDRLALLESIMLPQRGGVGGTKSFDSFSVWKQKRKILVVNSKDQIHVQMQFNNHQNLNQ